MAFPVVSVKMPASLAGQQNGKLPSNLLVKPGFPGRPLGVLHPLTSQAWSALARDIKAQFGETLTVTSTGDAYRNYNLQVVTFSTRYTTTRLPGRPTKTWNGVTYWQKPGTAMAAVPGTSNHGWGLAVDTCLYRNNAVVGITANMPMFNWMLLNAFRYGLSWEAQSEPWHLRYWSGDTVPPAVKPPTPTPIPPTPLPPGDDDDMIDGIYKSNSDAMYVWYTGGNKFWITDDGMWNGAIALCQWYGKSPEPHVVDPGQFAAMGLVIGPRPPGHDEWGNFVG